MASFYIDFVTRWSACLLLSGWLQVERENNMLQSQINMLMTMINEAPEVDDDDEM